MEISIECTVKVKAEESANTFNSIASLANIKVAHCFQNREKMILRFSGQMKNEINRLDSLCTMKEDATL